MIPESWTPHIPYIVLLSGCWRGNGTPIIEYLEQTKNYAIKFTHGGIYFPTLHEAAHWLTQNDYATANRAICESVECRTLSQEGWDKEWRIRSSHQPKLAEPKSKVKPKTDPTALLQKLGLL